MLIHVPHVVGAFETMEPSTTTRSYTGKAQLVLYLYLYLYFYFHRKGIVELSGSPRYMEVPRGIRCGGCVDQVGIILTPTLAHVNVPEKSTLLKRQVHRLIYDNYGSKLYERVQAVQNWSDKVQYGPRWSKIVIWICVPEIFSGTSSLLSTHFSGGGERFRRDGGAHGCFAP